MGKQKSDNRNARENQNSLNDSNVLTIAQQTRTGNCVAPAVPSRLTTAVFEHAKTQPQPLFNIAAQPHREMYRKQWLELRRDRENLIASAQFGKRQQGIEFAGLSIALAIFHGIQKVDESPKAATDLIHRVHKIGPSSHPRSMGKDQCRSNGRGLGYLFDRLRFRFPRALRQEQPLTARSEIASSSGAREPAGRTKKTPLPRPATAPSWYQSADRGY